MYNLDFPGQKKHPFIYMVYTYILFTQYIMTIYNFKLLFLTKKTLQKHNKHQAHQS